MKEKCPKSEILTAYLDVELEKGEMDQVERHLESCHLCQLYIKDLKELDQKIRAISTLDVPKRVDYRVEEYVQKHRHTWWWKGAIAITAGILCIVASYLFFFKGNLGHPNGIDMIVATNYDLFKDFEVIENLDFVEFMESVGKDL